MHPDEYANDLEVLFDRAVDSHGPTVAYLASGAGWAAYQASYRAGRSKAECEVDQATAFKEKLATFPEQS